MIPTKETLQGLYDAAPDANTRQLIVSLAAKYNIALQVF
jgi:hypothetical protein